MENLSSTLRGLGLSSYASRTLVALLANAPQSAGGICNVTGIPDSKIYYALEELDRAKLVESQHGTPTLYRPVPFEQLESNLLRAQQEEHRRRLRLVEIFRKQAEPLTEARAEPAQVELAYILKGRRNIVERMLTMIEQCRKEIVVLISNEELWRGVSEGQLKAKKHRIRVGIGATRNLTEAENMSSFGDLREMDCDCNLLISDSEKLVTVSHFDTEGAYAIVTSDKSMIRFSREFFDNPNCCVKT